MREAKRRRPSPALGFVLFALPFSACECAEELAPVTGSATLVGIVCDEATGLPEASRALRFEHDDVHAAVSGRTDEAGQFTLAGLPPGKGEIVISVDGLARREPVTLVEGETTIWRDPSCREGPAPGGFGAIEGRVCNRHVGDWVLAATVIVPLPDGSSLETTTDDTGFFSLPEVPSGLREVHVSAAGFSRAFLVEVEADEVSEMGVGEICEQGDGNAGYVSGALCDPTYEGPLAGASVRVVDAAGDEHVDVTDLEGSFVVGPMPPGDADVFLTRSPDVEEQLSVTVVAGQDAVVEAPWGCEGGGPPGGIEGRLCSPNGEFWLSDATVWVETDEGERFETVTDAEGRFSLTDVPPGEYVLYVRKGSFQASFDVVVEPEQVTLLPEEECAIVVEETRIAVVQGAYDSMETVLENLGIGEGITDLYSFSWAGSLLGDYATLRGYDIVILNCGAYGESDFFADAVYAANLEQWVAEGGSLYASDWSYDVIETLFPSKVEFHGDDLTRDAAQQASNTGDELADVVDVALAQALGQSSVEVKLWAPWAIMQSVASDVRVYIRGPAESSLSFDPDAPYTIGFEHGDGEVIYTSWHQEPGINVDAERTLQLLIFEL